MLRKISILVVLFIAIGIGFFALVIDRRMDGDTINIQRDAQIEAYCQFKGGDIIKESTEVYCAYGAERELASQFFDRLGEWEPSPVVERVL